MKVKFEFETPEERKELLSVLVGNNPSGAEPTEETMAVAEEALTDRMLDGLFGQYVRGLRMQARRNRHIDPAKLKMFGK